MSVRLTRHALARMEEMGVDRDEVLDAVAEPGVTYAGSHQSPPETISIRGRLGVATVVRGPHTYVITVLWSCREYVRAS